MARAGSATDDPYRRSQDFYVRAVGLGRGVVMGSVVTALVSAAGMAGFGAWAVYETKQGAGRVERYVVRMDPQGAVVGEVRVDKNWRPSDGDYIGFAMRWITSLRSRPLDEVVIRRQRRELQGTSERRIWSKIRDVVQRIDKTDISHAIDIESISAKIFSRENNGAVLVSVEWTESVRGGISKPKRMSAPLVLGYSQPATTAEFGLNPIGIYVLDFQIIEVQTP